MVQELDSGPDSDAHDELNLRGFRENAPRIAELLQGIVPPHHAMPKGLVPTPPPPMGTNRHGDLCSDRAAAPASAPTPGGQGPVPAGAPGGPAPPVAGLRAPGPRGPAPRGGGGGGGPTLSRRRRRRRRREGGSGPPGRHGGAGGGQRGGGGSGPTRKAPPAPAADKGEGPRRRAHPGGAGAPAADKGVGGRRAHLSEPAPAADEAGRWRGARRRGVGAAPLGPGRAVGRLATQGARWMAFFFSASPYTCGRARGRRTLPPPPPAHRERPAHRRCAMPPPTLIPLRWRRCAPPGGVRPRARR